MKRKEYKTIQIEPGSSVSETVQSLTNAEKELSAEGFANFNVSVSPDYFIEVEGSKEAESLPEDSLKSYKQELDRILIEESMISNRLRRYKEKNDMTGNEVKALVDQLKSYQDRIKKLKDRLNG